MAPLVRPLGGVWGGKAVALAQKVELLCGQKGRGVGREFLPAYKWSGGKKRGRKKVKNHQSIGVLFFVAVAVQ